MLRINLVLRFVFLGLLVKFGDVSYASFEDDCKSSKEISHRGRSAIVSDSEASFCDSLSAQHALSIGQMLGTVSNAVCGNDCAPTREDLAKHRKIANRFVKGSIARLNEIKDPANPDFLLTVGQLVSFWLLDIGIPVSSNWLSFVVDESGQRLSKAGALNYLIGNGGVVNSALSSISKNEPLIDSGRGTNIFRLSGIFFDAAKNFDAALRRDQEFRLGQCTLLYRACNGTVFSEQDLYLFNVLDEALICAATAQQLAGGDIARRVDRLEDKRADDAQRIARLEGQMGIVLHDRSFLHRPVTLIVNVAFYSWSWVPFHKRIEGMWDYVPFHEAIKGAVMGVPVLKDVLSVQQ